MPAAESWPYFLGISIAIGVDVLTNMTLKKSQGFTDKKYTLATIALIMCTSACIVFAARGFTMALFYAMWTTLGVLGTAIGGWLLFGQKLRPSAWLGIALLTGGIVLMY